ncbi:MAG: BACON domain-containing carbohydrate-binding protein [Bacteroidales bacterium]|nr:BACON domain-containing carbohydrate-binding protein [Bacteroidales bacterium]
MDIKKKIIPFLLLLYILSGCELMPTLKVSTSSLTVPDTANQTKISITTNTDWSISGANQWCSPSPSSGSGNAEVTLNISRNTTKESRSVKLTIYAGGLSSILTVTQKQDDAIILGQKEYSLPSGGGSIIIELSSNGEYEIIFPRDVTCVTEIMAKALSSYSHNLNVSPNDTYSQRIARILFKDKKSSLTDTLTITQAQKDGLILTGKQAQVAASGGTIEVELQSNIQYDIILPPGISWITMPSTKGLTLYTHQFFVSPNPEYSDRRAVIIFKDKNSTLADTLTVIQELKELLSIDKDLCFVPKEGGGVSFTLSTNVAYTTTISTQDWITTAPTKAVSTTGLNFSVNANPLSSDRTGRIILQSVSGKSSDTVEIVQSGTPGYYISLNSGQSISDYLTAEQYTSVKNLRLGGVVDPGNIAFIGNNLSELESLDLGNCSIPGNSIPQGAFKTTPPSVKKLKTITFPPALNSIGAEAFYSCTNLNSLILPANISEIGNSAFAYCNSIATLELPSSLTSIGEYAFRNCTSLSSVRSLIDTPFPLNNSFLGISPAAGLVVNTGKVSAYLLTSGWGNGYFNKIYEIGTNPDDRLTLNRNTLVSGGSSNTQIVNISPSSGWSVESKPDWVTLTPTSGTGESSISVTFSANNGNPERNGTVIFSLEGSTMRTSLYLTQYGNIYSDGEFVTLQSASSGNGVNIVFLGDGYNLTDIATGKYDNDLNQAVSHFFAVEPYTTYRNYFNVHIVYVYSTESGISDVNTTKNTALGVKYEEAAPSTRMSADDDACFGYADNAPISSLSSTLVIVVANSSRYAGTTYIWNSGHAIAICPISNYSYPYDFRGVIQHEAGGHGFGGCADEYVKETGYITAEDRNDLAMWQGWGFFKNVSLTNNLSEVSWKHFIGLPDYTRVGAWEGAYYYPLGVWRPEQTSCMIDNIRYFNAPSREMIVKRIMSRAGLTYTLEEFLAKDVTTTEAAAPPLSRYPAITPQRTLHPPVLLKGRPAGQ